MGPVKTATDCRDMTFWIMVSAVITLSAWLCVILDPKLRNLVRHGVYAAPTSTGPYTTPMAEEEVSEMEHHAYPQTAAAAAATTSPTAELSLEEEEDH
jgi:hypothetical protein